MQHIPLRCAGDNEHGLVQGKFTKPQQPMSMILQCSSGGGGLWDLASVDFRRKPCTWLSGCFGKPDGAIFAFLRSGG